MVTIWSAKRSRWGPEIDIYPDLPAAWTAFNSWGMDTSLAAVLQVVAVSD